MNVAHENQVPWPADRGITASRKSGPFRTNMVDYDQAKAEVES